MPYHSDFSHWPILVAHPTGSPQEGEVDAYLSDVSLALSRKENHVVILNTPQGTMSAEHRSQIAEWVRCNRTALAKYRSGLALVSEKHHVRRILAIIYWFSRPPFPYALFKTEDEALAWSRKQLGLDKSCSNSVAHQVSGPRSV